MFFGRKKKEEKIIEELRRGKYENLNDVIERIGEEAKDYDEFKKMMGAVYSAIDTDTELSEEERRELKYEILTRIFMCAYLLPFSNSRPNFFELFFNETISSKSQDTSHEEGEGGRYNINQIRKSALGNAKKEEDRGKEKKQESREPSDRELLIEILKELKEVNSNLKAMIVRMDTYQKRNEEHQAYVEEKLEGIFMGT